MITGNYLELISIETENDLLVKVHKNALSKLYFSNKTGIYVLITCDSSDLKSKEIKAGDVFFFDNMIDIKKTRFYEDSEKF